MLNHNIIKRDNKIGIEVAKLSFLNTYIEGYCYFNSDAEEFIFHCPDIGHIGIENLAEYLENIKERERSFFYRMSRRNKLKKVIVFYMDASGGKHEMVIYEQ